MRVLLSTIGSRGEAQPVIALAVRLKELGQEAVVCAPPDFRDRAESLGITYVPVGPELHVTAKRPAGAVPTPEQRRQMIEGTVADQFAAVGSAAEGCDVIVGGGALAIAAHSVAEQRGIGYVYAAFAPVTLPSPYHAPPVFGLLGEKPADGTVDNQTLWARDAHSWNILWSAALNAQRKAAGLAPVGDVSRHIFTDVPWLAADPTLAPWPEPSELDVFQTGAWILPDHRPLSPELEQFLEAGEPPIYFGFGSARAPEGVARTMIAAARAHGRRAILARGWAELSLEEAVPDCLAIGEVNQQVLLHRADRGGRPVAVRGVRRALGREVPGGRQVVGERMGRSSFRSCSSTSRSARSSAPRTPSSRSTPASARPSAPAGTSRTNKPPSSASTWRP
jgi:vancomycin aglycone glucosyltransferase